MTDLTKLPTATSSGTTGPSSTPRPGPRRTSGTTRSSPPRASTARPAAGSSPTSTRRPARSPRSRATPNTRAAAVATAPRGRPRSTRSYDPERVLYPMKRVGERGGGPVGAHQLGPGARRDRRQDPHRLRRGPPQRGHVPRRPPRRGRLHRPGAQGVGRRRPQQPHQHLLVERPHRLPELDGPRPTVVGLRQRRRSSS